MDINAFNLNAIYEATKAASAIGLVTLFLPIGNEAERIQVVKVIDALELAGIQVKLITAPPHYTNGEMLAELHLS